MAAVKQPVCLIVIDGWGMLEEKKGNAIANANTPVMDKLTTGNNVNIEAHGLHVGLPEGLMGNSEVGHQNIGAGRVVYQDIVRINLACTTGKINDNEVLNKAFENAKAKNGRLHFLGLVSDGGVHSHIEHLKALIKAAKLKQVPKCIVQFFGDGRDTSPTSGAGYLQQLLDFLDAEKYAEMGTIVGRYFAMDRDKRWERIKIAFDALVAGEGEASDQASAVELIKKRYAAGETDEFLKPIIIGGQDTRVQANDTIVFFNYRADRMRQINETFGLKRNFEPAKPLPDGLFQTTMTEFNAQFPFPCIFGPQTMKNVLAEWLANQKVPQFHCAETEKYAHVTFFFNGRVENVFDGEERCMVPSPKCATYDLQPEMSAAGVADKMIEALKTKKYPFLMCNFAPPDMVGHTGVYEAAIPACEATDVSIGRIQAACAELGYVMFVTSDHGNAEVMYDDKGGPCTAHTCHPVPFASTGAQKLKKTLPDRAPALRDVAPTCLAQMGLSIPTEMDGVSLLE